MPSSEAPSGRPASKTVTILSEKSSVAVAVLGGQQGEILFLAFQLNRHPLKLRLLGWYLSLGQIFFSLFTYVAGVTFSVIQTSIISSS
jgi:hypothetical protein